MPNQHRLIASSATTEVELPRGALGAPGAPGVISILAQFANEQRRDVDRLGDTTHRRFVVETLLTKSLSLPQHFNGAFTRIDGGSLVQLAPGMLQLKIETSYGAFEAELNDDGELALIRMSVEATTPSAARNLAHDAAAAFLDHLAYLAAAPVLTGLTKIWDERNQVTTLDLIGPDQPVVLNPGSQELPRELAPIYALYREFKNASSAFYRLLCLYKILEGVFNVLRPAANKAVRELGINIALPKEKVPSHPEIASHLVRHVGQPIKEFFDQVLQKEYRNVVAHFLIDKGTPLQTSAAADRQRFAEMAFLCDLCVRVVIANHEALLKRIDVGRSAQVGTSR